jgi:protein-S-isoprenylcysteine O-methyltransferase Ste14
MPALLLNMTALYTVAWIIGIVYATIPTYWLLVHPRIHFWRSRRARLMTVGPLWALLWAVAGGVTWPWRLVSLYHTPWTWIPAVALVATGLYIYSRARQDFSTDQVLGRSELQPERHEQRLNVRGIRARVRHPYYLGHLCELLGWTIGTGLLVLYCLTAFAVVTGAVMMRMEEAELEQRFGDEYREYKSRVPAFFPRL